MMNRFVIILVVFFSAIGLWGQNTKPFLEIQPYVPPADEQYPIHASVDHYYPTQTSNYLFIRLDGDSVTSTDPPAITCIGGQTCYDGHSGADIWMPKSIALLAAAPGTVVWARFEPGVSPCPNGHPPNGDLGVVIIDHHNGYYSTYLHMNPPLTVSEGMQVSTGDTIGYCGDSGCAGVPHIHFEIRKDAYFFDQDKSWVVDPYGWWGTTVDPIKNLRNNSSIWLWKSAELIDDGDNGFARFYGPDWQRLSSGYNNDAWTVPAVLPGKQSRHFAMWVPELPEDAFYDIQVFIPAVSGAINKASYELYIRQLGGTAKKQIITAPQDSITNAFFTIASLRLPRGANCALILRDVVAEGAIGSRVLFDAVRFHKNVMALDKNNSLYPQKMNLDVMPNQPNPVDVGHEGTSFVFKLQRSQRVKVRIMNILGQTVRILDAGLLSAGRHALLWDGAGDFSRSLPQGIYFYTVKAGNEQITKKLLLIR